MGDEINQPSVPSELGSCSPDPPGNACLPSPHHYPTLPLGKANPYLQSKWTEYVTRRQLTSRNGQPAEPAPSPNLPCQPPFITSSWFCAQQRSLWRQRPNISFLFCILLLPPGVRGVLSFCWAFSSYLMLMFAFLIRLALPSVELQWRVKISGPKSLYFTMKMHIVGHGAGERGNKHFLLGFEEYKLGPSRCAHHGPSTSTSSKVIWRKVGDYTQMSVHGYIMEHYFYSKARRST